MFRAFWQVTDKELLPWLLVEKPSTLISVTHSTDIPKVLISARRKGIVTPFMFSIHKYNSNDNYYICEYRFFPLLII